MRELRQGLQLWQEIDAPYEASRARMLLARAARAVGDEDTARLELSAAKATFERIGARGDARDAAAELGDAGASDAPAQAHVTRTFLFTDIVNSTSLIGVIGDDAWRSLIRWHDDALRSVVAQHEGEEIRHQGTGWSFPSRRPTSGSSAPSASAALGRAPQGERLRPCRAHRHPQTDAIKRGLDYAASACTRAARVGALAADGEILVTRSTLEGASNSPIPRESHVRSS